jgi:predicted nuclease of predicted toxin-antitoxin system
VPSPTGPSLLFDENLSHRLVDSLADVYPGSTHVRTVGLASATDDAVWEFARTGGFLITSKDADFHQRSFVYGAPPKVVWVRRGNCSTREIEMILRTYVADVAAFAAGADSVFLALA